MVAFEFIPPEAQKLGLILLLSFLIGLEHEEHREADQAQFFFGGVRTFPLLGILGYTLALLASPGGGAHPEALAAGILVVGAFMVLSFQRKLSVRNGAGITSEVSGLLTFLLGAVVFQEHFWVATALVVIGVLLLELKSGLENLARKIPPQDLLTFTKFLLLSAVILPILPNEPFTSFQINPQKTWIIVVAISAISYVSYILQKVIGGRGAMISALLGGAYSSTVTTLALSKRSVGEGKPRLYSGSILSASGVMYVRLAILVLLFGAGLGNRLAPSLALIGVGAIGMGWLWTLGASKSNLPAKSPERFSANPLELHSALLFAAIFVGMLVLTRIILGSLGEPGVYGLSVLTGVTDVDPFILGLTQSAGKTTPFATAAAGILIAAASNNVVKGIYAWFFSDRETGKLSAILMLGLALVGLLPLLYFI